MHIRQQILILLFLIISILACEDGTKENNETVNKGYELLPDEIQPRSFIQCFPGSYYRKIVSSVDYWLGIGGTVILPEMTFDKLRINPNKPQQFLDNPSIYLGGNMGGQETDIGLTWEVIKDDNGIISDERKAFRPFMRRTAHHSGQKAVYLNAPAESKYYWYPGDKINISIQIIENHKIKFVVEGEDKKFETIFPCDGYSIGNKGEFKRVNAIDQVGNEGKSVQATQTKIENCKWERTFLYRSINNEISVVPMHIKRFTDMRCPNTEYFKIIATEEDRKIGAEIININGSGY